MCFIPQGTITVDSFSITFSTSPIVIDLCLDFITFVITLHLDSTINELSMSLVDFLDVLLNLS